MVAHEYAHAEAAYRQGDDTAYMLGRLTLNPIKHIDPFMTVLLPIVLWYASGGTYTFGGAKPVPVNPRNYRRYVRGDIIVSLAGIATNLGLFVVCTALFALIGLMGRAAPGVAATLGVLQLMLYYGMWLNLMLAFFNLIPIPPLDGSHVLKHLLPAQAGLSYRRLYAFGFLPIMAIAWFAPVLLRPFLWPASHLMRLGLTLVGQFALPGGIPS